MLYSHKDFCIRAYQKGDEASLALHANSFAIWELLQDFFPHPYTYDDATQWVDMNIKLEEPMNFVIDVNGDAVGSIGIIPGVDIHKKNLEIGYWIGTEYWGRGIVTSAVNWLTTYCFENYDVHRIWASVFSTNSASKKVLERNGFQHEATLKENIFKNGVFLDEHIYSLLK